MISAVQHKLLTKASRITAATSSGCPIRLSGSLFLCLGPAGRQFPLAHFNRDLFVYAPMAEAPKARMGVSFLIGPGGKASEVTIEDLDEYGMGRLTRVITK
jgi:hypothetical protein